MAGSKFSRLAFSALAFAVAPIARAEQYGSMMAALLPPGRALRNDKLLAKVLLACGDELWRLEGRVNDLLIESDPTDAVELLPEFERELDLTATPSIPERQARIVARLITRQRFRPADFQDALAMLLSQAAEDVVVIERTRAFCIAIGDYREIFRFFIYRDPGLPGAYFLSSAQDQVDRMKPSHTLGHVIESTCFICDDPFSLCDRDILGAVPSFVAASTAVTARSTTITLSTPAGVLPGDTLLVFAFSANTTQSDMTTGSLPAGWSLLSRIGTGNLTALLRRVVVSGEPASHVFAMTSTGVGAPLLGVMVAYRNMDNGTSLVGASAVTLVSTVSFPCPSLTRTSASDLYIGWCGTNNNTASAICPDGAIELVDQSAAQNGFNRAVLFTLSDSTAGATGIQTVTMSLPVSGVAASYVLRAAGP